MPHSSLFKRLTCLCSQKHSLDSDFLSLEALGQDGDDHAGSLADFDFVDGLVGVFQVVAHLVGFLIAYAVEDDEVTDDGHNFSPYME